ncbi:hypothetical protein [Sunxiuqinia dokdonensis]|uniref:Uncharacterized protein n=1 Tax=Sunxiuqinia dokdonensis TaxID=1409788 RepID=A0A0L8VC18_9BACT|nr:hypothetical protein [Sunxiuqinia dokdonensis]KOH45702.1 hypothetical protein NC99_14780 [Sunxiuqinia dokdonensis]
MQLFNYQKIVELNVWNDYYQALQSSDFQFIPEKATQRTLRNMGLKLKELAGGFRLFSAVDETGKLQRDPVSVPFKLVVFMRLNNPLFINFSDLPFDLGASKAYYFSNQANNKREVFGTGSDSLLLNQNEVTTAADQIKTSGKVYSYTHPGDAGIKTAELVSVDTDETVASQELAPVDEHYNFQFILEGLSAGRYKLMLDGGELDRFYYAGELAVASYFGVVELFSHVDVGYKWFTNAGLVSSKTYCLAFKRRETLWRYKVINRNGLEMPNPGVRETDTPWEFTHSGDHVFVSNIPMPLKEAPITGIALRSNQVDAASVLINDLPNPGPELIKPDPGNPATIYSDIYVYL